jgi:hypothetical protein
MKQRTVRKKWELSEREVSALKSVSQCNKGHTLHEKLFIMVKQPVKQKGCKQNEMRTEWGGWAGPGHIFSAGEPEPHSRDSSSYRAEYSATRDGP